MELVKSKKRCGIIKVSNSMPNLSQEKDKRRINSQKAWFDYVYKS